MYSFRWKTSMMAASILFLILGGCSQDMEVSAEEIIHNALESEKQVDAYYGKSEMTHYEGEELIEESVMEEYHSGSEIKFITHGEEEIEIMNNEEKSVIYNKSDGTAQEVDTPTTLDYQLTPKEMFQNMLSAMEDSHDYEIIGDEEISGRDAFRMKLEAKEANSLLGDMEIWVDKETWMIVKVISDAGDSKMEFIYTELDFSPDFTEDTFTLDIPDDVEITKIDGFTSTEVTSVEEAEEELGQAFYMFPEDEYHVGEMELYDLGGEFQRKEFDLTYISENDRPVFSLSIFEAPEGMEIEESDVDIRGNAAAYEESITNYYWDENGLRYSLMIQDLAIEEEILELTEDMVLSSELDNK